ncbi:MAG: PQQ-binding-like beta-propeller repeat protein [Rubinisphaera brasiliensis]|uniref:PQQ-binding-like beta-propeller repeat protein n=1 Tax=Rubinisphaera brasiliensis TaxID=119 RepID=UPI00391C4E07
MKQVWIVCLSLLVPSLAMADDWPSWMGPQRDNVWRETGIVDSFPASGPKVLWRTPIAGGYAGPAVANGRVYVTDYVTADDVKVANFQRAEFSGTERVLCLDEKTGKEIWKHEYPVKYGISYPAGPRCTPNVHQGKVYTLGAEGHLICFDEKTGKVLWQKHLPRDYNTKTPLWGYAAHPLIDGQKLISVVGGEGTHAVAFDKDTGEEIWRTLTTREQGYCPPRIIEAAGVRQLLLLYPSGLSAVNPETGKPYWTVPYEANNGSIIMTPVHAGEYIFVGGFNNRNLLVKLNQDKPDAEMVWQDKRRAALSPVNVQPFLVEQTMYGFDQNGALYGVDVPTGERLWETSEPLNSERPLRSGTAFIIKNGDRFFLFNELGELLIAELSRDGYKELDSMKVIKPTNLANGRDVVWSPPAWANKKVFVRNDEEIISVDLAK